MLNKEDFTKQVKEDLKNVILPVEVGDDEYKRVTDYLVTVGFFNRFWEMLRDIKGCKDCGTFKMSNPTPDGDEICPSCGDKEMMDLEIS